MSLARSVAAVIGDVVSSRAHPDRARLQAALEDALRGADRRLAPLQASRPTVGDEFQALFADIPAAIEMSLVVRLLMWDEADVRFGIGWGELTLVDAAAAPFRQDGPAWWSARAAITELRTRATAPGIPHTTRTMVAEDPELNALLVCRDEIVTQMDARDARLLLGMIDGVGQAELAGAEGVSQPAISQRLHRSGAYAVLDAHRMLR